MQSPLIGCLHTQHSSVTFCNLKTIENEIEGHENLMVMMARCICKIFRKKVQRQAHHANLILPVTIILQHPPYRITFFTIRFAISLEEFAINAFLATATFKAFLVVDFPKGCTTFHAYWLPTNSTNTWNDMKLTKWFWLEMFLHSVEISGFFYQSDFTWNLLWRI